MKELSNLINFYSPLFHLNSLNSLKFGDGPLVTLLRKYFSNSFCFLQGFPVHIRATETYRNERPCKLVVLFLKKKPVTAMKTRLKRDEFVESSTQNRQKDIVLVSSIFTLNKLILF